jgi:hypothetical protein
MVVVTNSNRKQIFASFQSPKPQRAMRGIGLPKLVILFGEALDPQGGHERAAKIVGWLETSPARRPIFEEIVFPVRLCFLAQKVKLAGCRITI